MVKVKGVRAQMVPAPRRPRIDIACEHALMPFARWTGGRAADSRGRHAGDGSDKAMDSLERMLIERECERLVTLYCHLIDHGEAAKVGDLFAEDGVWASFEQTMTGREGVTRGFTNRQNNAGRMSRHICNNLLIDVIDESHATGVVYLTLHRHDGEPGRRTSPIGPPTLVGEYRDTFVKTADGWRFQRRDVTANFV